MCVCRERGARTVSPSPDKKLMNWKHLGDCTTSYTSTAPRPYYDRTSTASRAYLNHTASVCVDCTVQEGTVPCHERVRVTAYLERAELGTIVRSINVAVQFGCAHYIC